MRIEASSLGLASTARTQVDRQRQQRIEQWDTRTEAVPPSTALAAAPRSAKPSASGSSGQGDSLLQQLAKAARTMAAKAASQAVAAAKPAAPAGVADGSGQEQELDSKSQQILSILEKVFGMKGITAISVDRSASVTASAMSYEQTTSAQAQAGWGVRYEATETLTTSEYAGFAASGTVQTADGRTLAFDLSYEMQRTVSITSSTRFTAGDGAVSDPLMINLDGGIPRLGSNRMAIDLDGNGRLDAPAAPAPGTWILAMDRDGNRRVEDRSDLFGPTTGNGFAELGGLDQDRNGWLDEADAAWSMLGLWDGAGTWKSLRDLGVGAISTAHAALPMTAEADGVAAGKIRAGGVALSEEGRPLAMQQIDLSI